LNGEEEWEVINLPARCESENDLLGRKMDEVLWPGGGYDAEWAQRTKREVGSRVWASLYQQRPAPADGNIFMRDWWQFYSRDYHRAKDLKIWHVPPVFEKVIQSWDFTFKDSGGNDFVVGQIWGKSGADSFLLDQWRDRADFVRSLRAMRKMTAQWPGAKAKYVEDKANGSAIISALKRELPGIIPVEPQGGKEARASAVTPEIEAGNIFLPCPEEAPWVNDFILECAAFPNGAYDDQVDAMSQALSKLYVSSMKVMKPRGAN
jgi:predicted phage terminase large subunit-like protein